jgi:hypothetical protein
MTINFFALSGYVKNMVLVGIFLIKERKRKGKDKLINFDKSTFVRVIKI